MAVFFEGFPRVLDRSALKPGRWFLASLQRSALLCFSTDVEMDDKPVVLTFRTAKPEQIEFSPYFLDELTGQFTTVEDDLIFSPGESPEKLQLASPSKRSFPSGALLRLRNGDLGVGFMTRISRGVTVISLSSGAKTDGFDLVFDRWSLSLRRGGTQTMIGHFRAPLA
jgi:hypothetical protein